MGYMTLITIAPTHPNPHDLPLMVTTTTRGETAEHTLTLWEAP